MAEFNDNQFWMPKPPAPMMPLPPRHVPVLTHIGDEEEYDALVLSYLGEGPKGDKGDPMHFDDLTEEQLQEIYREASFVANETDEAVVTTTGASTTTIAIPLDDFDQFDMLFVDVNGLDLCEHEDYEIVGANIVLTTPLPAGQDVHFKGLRYRLVDGDKTIMNYMGRKDYNTVSEMQADPDLQAGDICHALGKSAVGDLLGGWFKVSSHGVADNVSVFLLDNGCYATRIQSSLILQTPDQTKWYMVSIDNSGNLVTTQIIT